MIPESTYEPAQDVVNMKYPTSTYRLKDNRIIGYTDSLDAMQQAVYKVLHTERYRYLIYSWQYGIELEDLFGMQPAHVYPVLQLRIEDCLLADSRISGVDNFDFSYADGSVTASFTVHTDYGEIHETKEVKIQ